MRICFRLLAVVVCLSVAAACHAADAPVARAPSPVPAIPSSVPPAVEPSEPPGDPAVWVVGPNEKLGESTTSFLAVVWRSGCNGGVTGQVLAPIIEKSAAEIVVTFSVLPRQTGAAACPGNDEVTYRVDLGEPLRGRALVDGQCLREEGQPGFCREGATRFKP